MRLALAILAIATIGTPALAQGNRAPALIVPVPVTIPAVRTTPPPPHAPQIIGSLFDSPKADAPTARSVWGEPTVPNPQGLVLEPSPESTYMRVWRAITRSGCHEDWLFQFAWWNGVALDMPIPDNLSALHLPETIDDCSKQPPPPEQNMSGYIRRMEELRTKVQAITRKQ